LSLVFFANFGANCNWVVSFGVGFLLLWCKLRPQQLNSFDSEHFYFQVIGVYIYIYIYIYNFLKIELFVLLWNFFLKFIFLLSWN
jgi:hypothetical protein